MKYRQECAVDDVSDRRIIETLRNAAEESEAFSATSEWGYGRLMQSFDSRGDCFDRSGAVVFEYEGTEVLRVPVACLPATIGCGEKVDYVLDHPGISRMHCHLESAGNLVRICDNASTNGIFLNRKRIKSEDLCDGDEVKLGTALLRIRKA